MQKNSIKYHVGKFSLTDKESALTITAKVERSSNFVDALFWIEVFPYDQNKASISIAFDVVELRGFASQLEELHLGKIQSARKHSGGNASKKLLSVVILEPSGSVFMDFSENKRKISFFMSNQHMLKGLSKQLEHMIDATMSAVYKTQQYIEKTKEKS